MKIDRTLCRKLACWCVELSYLLGGGQSDDVIGVAIGKENRFDVVQFGLQLIAGANS